MKRCALSIVLLFAISACSSGRGEGGGDGAGGADAGADGSTGPTFDARPEPPKGSALIVPIKGGNMAQIAIMTLYDDGDVVDDGLRLDTGGDPRKAAIRPDGREAAVIWAGYPGGPGSPKGVTFVELGNNPASDATVSATLELDISDEGSGEDYQQSPVDIIYISDDEVLIAVRGPDVDGVIPAKRVADSWELGKLTPIEPGGIEGPLEVHGVPGTDDAIVLTFGSLGKVYTLRRSPAGTWSQIGAYAQLDNSTLRVAVHREGEYAYLSSMQPIESLSDPEVGRFQIFEAGDDDAWEETGSILLSGVGSQTIIDPNGLFAVVPDYTPSPDRYTFMTIDLATPGEPKELATTSDVDGFLMRDFEVGPGGQMVVSIDTAGAKHLMTMIQRTPGDWQTVWGPVSMPGGIDDVAVATVSHTID